jgi:hypothetical protein
MGRPGNFGKRITKLPMQEGVAEVLENCKLGDVVRFSVEKHNLPDRSQLSMAPIKLQRSSSTYGCQELVFDPRQTYLIVGRYNHVIPLTLDDEDEKKDEIENEKKDTLSLSMLLVVPYIHNSIGSILTWLVDRHGYVRLAEDYSVIHHIDEVKIIDHTDMGREKESDLEQFSIFLGNVAKLSEPGKHSTATYPDGFHAHVIEPILIPFL